MRLFYVKEKLRAPLGHGGKTIKKHMFQWKNLFKMIFLLKWKLLKYLWKRKKMGKNIQDAEPLAKDLQKWPCLCEKRNKGYKERDCRKILGEQLSSF